MIVLNRSFLSVVAALLLAALPGIWATVGQQGAPGFDTDAPAEVVTALHPTSVVVDARDASPVTESPEQFAVGVERIEAASTPALASASDARAQAAVDAAALGTQVAQHR